MGLGIPIIDAITTVIDRVIPDPRQKAQLNFEIAKLADQENQREHDEQMGQIGVNTEEAKSSSLFVAGWRPAIGWVGAFGLAYSFILEPFISWIAKVAFSYRGDFPAIDTSSLMVLVTGMLGFGGLRTYEKYKGVSQEGPIPIIPSTPDTSIIKGTPAAPAQPPKKKGLDLWPF